MHQASMGGFRGRRGASAFKCGGHGFAIVLAVELGGLLEDAFPQVAVLSLSARGFVVDDLLVDREPNPFFCYRWWCQRFIFVVEGLVEVGGFVGVPAFLFVVAVGRVVPREERNTADVVRKQIVFNAREQHCFLFC